MTTAGVIILGNTGAGKSFLANVILGQEAFVHKIRSSAVTLETEHKPCQINDKSYAVYNIPGLVEANQARIDLNKREIDRAFTGHPYGVVLFVFGAGNGGRIRDEDTVAFDAINQAYPLGNKSLIIIVNNIPNIVPPDERNAYESDTTSDLKGLLKIGFEHICFIYQINPTSANEKQAVQTKLLEKIKIALPKTHKKEKEISLQATELSKLKRQMADLRKQIEEERQRTQEREEKIRREERERATARSRQNNDDVCGPIVDGMMRMMSDCNRPSTNTIMYLPSSPMRPSSSVGHGNQRTGEYVASSGSANGREVWTGPRGGRKYLNANGNWTYL